MQRGAIQNRQRANQVRDFTGLRFGKITPTDIDGLLDFRNKLFVFIEGKYGSAPVPFGQRLALERLCDAIQKAGIMSAVLIARHETPADQDIDFARCQVTEYRFNYTWQPPKEQITCRAAIERLLEIGGIL